MVTAYVTTNVRYISLIEDKIASDNPQVLKSHDNDLKNLFVSLIPRTMFCGHASQVVFHCYAVVGCSCVDFLFVTLKTQLSQSNTMMIFK